MKIFVSATVVALFAFWPFAASAQSTTTTLFVQRAAAQNPYGSPVQVTIAALPPGWAPPIPLPANAPILGTVSAPDTHSVTIYYQPANAREAYDAYLKQLQEAGFKPAPLSVSTSGFAAIGIGVPRLTQFCHGTQGVTIIVPTDSPDDLRVSVPESTSLNLCSVSPRAFGQVVTPLPSLVVPRGASMIAMNGGGATTALTQFGSPVTTVTSSAMIRGDLSIADAMQSFVSQLQRAGWQITNKIAGRDAAVAAFSIQRPNAHWTGSLSVYRAPQPHSFVALVDASGGSMKPVAIGPPLPALPHLATRLTKSNEPALVQLATRLAGEGGTATLYVAQLPPKIDRSVPLPNSKPIGSTFVRPMYGGSSRYAIYYTLSNAQLQSYFSRLKAAGWTALAQPGIGAVGFQGFGAGGSTMFCHAGKIIGVGAQPSTGAVDLVFDPSPAESCTNQAFPMMVNPALQRSPLPKLTAPPGVTMRSAFSGVPNGNSGAVFISELPLTQLLDSFAPQLAAAGWSPGASSIGDAVGSRSFSITDNRKQQWQAVLTVYRSTAQADRYYAFIDLTNVSNDGTGL